MFFTMNPWTVTEMMKKWPRRKAENFAELFSGKPCGRGIYKVNNRFFQIAMPGKGNVFIVLQAIIVKPWDLGQRIVSAVLVITCVCLPLSKFQSGIRNGACEKRCQISNIEHLDFFQPMPYCLNFSQIQSPHTSPIKYMFLMLKNIIYLIIKQQKTGVFQEKNAKIRQNQLLCWFIYFIEW